MKSIREWKDQKLAEELGIDPVALRKVIGGSTLDVDVGIKAKLRTRLFDIMREYPEMEKSELLRQIIAVAGSLMTDMSGTKIGTNRLAKNLGGQE